MEEPRSVYVNIKTPKTPSKIVQRDHPEDFVIGNIDDGLQLIKNPKKVISETNLALLSTIEPKDFNQAFKDESWKESMKEELSQIENNKTWELVPRPKYKNVISTKWVFKNKMIEEGKIVRNKSRLVCKGYTQVEGEDFDETFPPLPEWKPSNCFLHIHVSRTSQYTRWM